MRLRLRVFGWTVVSVTLDGGPALDVDVAAPAGPGPVTQTELAEPVTPEDRYREYEFGFKTPARR